MFNAQYSFEQSFCFLKNIFSYSKYLNIQLLWHCLAMNIEHYAKGKLALFAIMLQERLQ